MSARGPSSAEKIFFLDLRLSGFGGQSGGDGDGDQLFGEAAGGLGGEGLLVAAESEFVLVLAGDVVMAGDALGGEPHGEERGGVVLGEPGIGCGLESAEGQKAHGLDAAGHDDTVAAGADAQIGLDDGFEAGGAEAVDGDAGNFDGQLGAQGGKAGDVPALFALGLGAAEDDVVDLGFLEAGDAVERSVDGEGREVVGAGGGEGAFGGAANGSANGADNDGFLHGFSLDDARHARRTIRRAYRAWSMRSASRNGRRCGGR